MTIRNASVGVKSKPYMSCSWDGSTSRLSEVRDATRAQSKRNVRLIAPPYSDNVQPTMITNSGI